MKGICFWAGAWLLLMSCGKSATGPDAPDVLAQLESVPGLEVQEITPANGCSRQFEIYLQQPVDHGNPDGPCFRQRIYLSHEDADLPMIFMPSGYSASPVKKGELTACLQGNQVYAAHRYMLGACPDAPDWRFLTIEQASHDFHRIVEILKNIYQGSWVSYGVSKNGQAALYHRRFFPDDVDATVVLGAAFSTGVEDERYERFLSEVGTAEDRARITRFQRHALGCRQALLPMIEDYMSQSDFSFTRMGAGEILEYEIMEFPFGFWQSGPADCSQIPDTTATAQMIFEYLVSFGYFDSYSDEMLEFFQPVYYQAFAELGWYRMMDDPVKDLLQSVAEPSFREFAPPGSSPVYNPAVMADIRQWMQREGDKIIYIYGELDPWSAGGLESTGSADALLVHQPGAGHSLTIDQCDQAESIYATLNLWMESK